MLRLFKNKKNLFKTIFVFGLILSNLAIGFPLDGLLKVIQDKKIVDVLYLAYKDGKVIDTAIRSLIPEARADASSNMMMAYDTQDILSVPKYRTWNGSAWGAEASANAVNGEIRYMTVKYSPTRDEAMMVTLGSTGQVQAQVFNGSAWGSPSLLGTMNNSNGDRDVQSLYRGFDIEYEQSSGDAIIVYGDGTADPNYRVWNGSTWSSENNIDIPTTGRPNWIELASRPGSDELAMIVLDANVDTYGMRWTGSAWDAMGTSAVWDATCSIATEKSIDVAFEATSGDIMFIWGDAKSTDQYYRTYSGSTLSAATLLDNAQAGAVNNWMKLAPNPTAGSNQILYGVLDGGSDLNTFLWSGTAWSAVHTEHSAAVEAHDEMLFDIGWETHASNPNDAWLIWGDGATVSRKVFDAATTWGTATTVGDDSVSMRLNVQPNSGAVLVGVYEDVTSATDDITAFQLTGGSQTWSGASQIWTGPVGRRSYFLIDIASQVYNSSTEAMMIYDTRSITSIPKYRIWSGSSWAAESNASSVNGEVRHTILKFSPTRNEAILATLGSTGEVNAQIWNGSTWSASSLIGTMNDANTDRDTQSLYRGFDIEYEQSSGDAIIVYGDGTADPNYRVWNGSTWSSENNIDIPTTGRPNWIELASRPGSDELAFISLDSASDVYGMRWTGSVWDNMGVATAWETTASIATKQAVDVEFEKTTGNIMFAWGYATVATAYFRYRYYSNSTLGAVTNITNANNGGVVHWLKLIADPTSSSNKLMIGGLDAGADLNTYEWSGSAWSAVHTEHSAGTEDIVDTNFDIIYETHSSNPGIAWLVYGNGATVSSKRYSGGVWAAATTRGDDTADIVLGVQPSSGAVFCLSYEDDTSAVDDIRDMSLTDGSSTWSAQAITWAGPVARNLGSGRIALAPQLYQAPSGALAVDIVDGAGASVASPSISMGGRTFSFIYQTATGIFGDSNQKIRVSNTTGSPTWTLSLAASGGATAYWDGTTRDYDFNDPTANAGDGGDADNVGGQMVINPSVGTITPQGGCNTTGISQGNQASFSQGVTDSITLVSASASAGVGCYWDLTGVGVSQTVPAEMPAGNYSINMTLTAVAS